MPDHQSIIQYRQPDACKPAATHHQQFNSHIMKTSFQDLVNSKTPTVIDFFATWCGPCRMVTPILEDLKSELGENIRVYKIDVDQNPGIAAEYNVRSIPTIMIFKNGKLQWREAGVQSKATLKNVISTLK